MFDEPVTLASGSATRLKLLQDAGFTVRACKPGVDEDAIKHAHRAEGADAVALRLARAKAEAVAADGWVIGADQLLVCGGRWFDKPRNRAEAAEHLRFLRGRTHVLHTAMVVLRNGAVHWQHVAHPVLTMHAFSDAFLEAYLDAEGDAVLSSVGAYRLEGRGQWLFERMEGEHAAVLGLPMLVLLRRLAEHHRSGLDHPSVS